MAVQQLDQNFGMDGHAKSINAFRRAHFENSDGILNAAAKLPADAPRPVYNPNHPDNQWPVMLHHPEKGEMPVGRNLAGMEAVTAEGKALRAQVVKQNQADLKAAKDAGYREEPYLKPQVAVADPVVEKARQQAEVAELRGMITQQNDLIQKLLNKA